MSDEGDIEHVLSVAGSGSSRLTLRGGCGGARGVSSRKASDRHYGVKGNSRRTHRRRLQKLGRGTHGGGPREMRCRQSSARGACASQRKGNACERDALGRDWETLYSLQENA